MKRKRITSNDIFKILDYERRNNFNSVTAFAKKLEIGRTRYDKIMSTLQNENSCRGVSFNKVSELLEKAGYMLKIKKI